HASSPFIRGMVTSNTMTSGSRSFAFSTASAPSDASPMTCQPGRPSKRVFKPCLTIGWSSTSSMRIAIPFQLRGEGDQTIRHILTESAPAYTYQRFVTWTLLVYPSVRLEYRECCISSKLKSAVPGRTKHHAPRRLSESSFVRARGASPLLRPTRCLVLHMCRARPLAGQPRPTASKDEALA